MFQNVEKAPFMEGWSRRLPLKIHPTFLLILPFSDYLFRRPFTEAILSWRSFGYYLRLPPLPVFPYREEAFDK